MLAKELARANKYLVETVGVEHKDIEDEAWYECEVFNRFKDIAIENSISGQRLYYLIGTRVYPTIKESAGMPPHLVTPLDFIKFEAEGYLLNHLGDEIKPREIIKAIDGEVLMEASTPGYNPDFMRGVYAGILKMCGVENFNVEYVGDDKYSIKWEE